jgi:release factor glutamine methyltransferase
MDFYAPLADIAIKLLKDGGALIVEHGFGQGDLVREVFAKAGLHDCMTIRDYGANPRVTIGIK